MNRLLCLLCSVLWLCLPASADGRLTEPDGGNIFSARRTFSVSDPAQNWDCIKEKPASNQALLWGGEL